jgi:feruloyl esterase
MKKKATTRLALGALTATAGALSFAQAHAADCEGLVGKTVGGGTIVSAERMAAGQDFKLPPNVPPGIKLPQLSAGICQVKARLQPVPGSDIKVEVWLPGAWNGKFVGIGGGGFSGGLDSALILLNPLVAQGYAGAATDVGHPSSEGAQWAYKHPVQLVDWAHRGNHVTAEFGKALVAAYYAKPVQRAYFHGCSNGGRDALMEAWRYPQDYDGIVAGAPAAPWVRDMTAFAWNMKALEGPPKVVFTPAKLKLVTDAVMAQCDALDGVKDGVLENPLACHFDPGKLKCKTGAGQDCLSGEEVTALRKIYQGPRTKNGRQISAGWPVGGESVEWANWITGPKPAQGGFAVEFPRWMVYGDPSWSLDRFDLDKDYATAQSRMGPIINSDNPDIRPFLKHGGKLILYHGWADGALPPGNTITYYEAVRRTAPAASRQVRLFMAPGMAHCFGGAGPSKFDMVAELDKWFEGGQPPERVIASKPENFIASFVGLPTKTVQTRPLCAWPQQARWTGTGSTDEAANFRCVTPK